MRTQWGVGIGFEALPNQGEDAVVPVAVERVGSQQLPTRLSWRSGLYFELPPTNWSVIYARGKQPVMVERRFGQGSLVMMSDAYLLSNEGLYRERELGLVSWLVGSRRRVWFDEAHLGVVSNPGVSVLVRRYRLHGAVAALVLLAGLFAWQQAARFLPTESRPEGRGESAVRGRDSGTGYLTLLKRHVRPEDLAVVCWEEWRRDCGRTDAAAPEARLEVAEALVKMESMRLPRDRDPVATCRALAEALNARAGGVVPGTEDQSHER
jgi:hypothetical protein